MFDEVTRGEASMFIKNCTLFKPYPLLLLAIENDGAPDAMLEKEQGNEYFKEKRYAEAIDCIFKKHSFTANSRGFCKQSHGLHQNEKV